MKVRHIEKKDIPEIKVILEQPSCFNNTFELPYPSLDSVESRFGSLPENFYGLVAVVEEKIAGIVGLQVFSKPRRKHVAVVALTVNEKYKRNRVGFKLTESIIDLAVNWLAVSRVELQVFTDNDAAISLYKKFEFVIEGTAKSYAFRNGNYVDIHHMAKVF
jgi:putative acetyltransferase